MTKEELDKIRRRTPKELLADEYPTIAVTCELNLEWWRGYHVGRNVAKDAQRLIDEVCKELDEKFG